MINKIFGTSNVSWVICLSMFIALSTHAERSATATAPFLSGGSAVLEDFTVICGTGLLPLVLEGNLEGEIDVPRSKVSFHGKHARLGYCGYPGSGTVPLLVSTDERSVNGDVASFITVLKGPHLSCVNGQLPLVLEGSAEGALNTTKGTINLHGDHNEVAVCLVQEK